MGGKEGGGGPDLGPMMDLANMQKGIAMDVWNRSKPLAGQVFGDLESLLSGSQGSVMRTAFAPARDALELQFQNAQRGIMENSPARSGLMHSQLGQLQTDRAMGIGSLESDLLKNAFAMASNIATGAPTQAGGLLGGAGNMLGNVAQMQQQQAQTESQESMAKGGGLGNLAGIGLMTGLMPGGWMLPMFGGLGAAMQKPGAGGGGGAPALGFDPMATPWGTTFPT